MCGFKYLKVYYLCSKYRKFIGRESVTYLRDDSRFLDFVICIRIMILFFFLCVFFIFCIELCEEYYIGEKEKENVLRRG